MSYLNCIGETCERVGKMIHRGATQAVASIPTPRNYYKWSAREAIKKLSPDAFAFYQEAYEHGAHIGEGRLDSERVHEMGLFDPRYPFPEGPIDATKAFKELEEASLIYNRGQHRIGSFNGSRENDPIRTYTVLIEMARNELREKGLRTPSGSYLPNSVLQRRKEIIQRPVTNKIRNLEHIEMIGEAKQLPPNIDNTIASFITGTPGPVHRQRQTLKRSIGYSGPVTNYGVPEKNRYFSNSKFKPGLEARKNRRHRKSRKVRKH